MNEKKHNLIYQITNTINGKIYLGQHMTDDLDDGYMGSGKAMKAAIKKHGLENFTKVILHDFDTFDEMNAKEEELVGEAFVSRKDTYNLMTGGSSGSHSEETLAKLRAASLGKKHTPEARAKMSAAQMGREVTPETRAKIGAARKGKTLTPEHRAKLSAAGKCRTHTPETRAKMSDAAMGNTHFLGKKHTKETRAKIGAGNKGRKRSPESIAKQRATCKANRERKQDHAQQAPIEHTTFFYLHHPNVTPEPIFGAAAVAAVMAHEIVTLGPILG
jgi:group I intron endonuclease